MKDRIKCLLRFFVLLTAVVLLLSAHFLFDLKTATQLGRKLLLVINDRSKEGDASPSLPLCPPPPPPVGQGAIAAASTVPPSAGCSFCRERHKTNGRFYNFSTERLRLFAFSAFYDDRPSLMATTTPGNGAVVRVVAISDSVGHLKTKNASLSLFCVLFYSSSSSSSDGRRRMGMQRVVAMEGVARDCGPSYDLNRSIAYAHVFTCSKAEDAPRVGQRSLRPHSLSIVGSEGAAVSSCMPIEYPVPEEKEEEGEGKEAKEGDGRLQLVVCVPVSYGSMDPFRLIEWLEVQRLMGVQRVAVYDLYLSSPALRVLRAYEAEGFVELRKMDRIFPRERNKHLLELAMSLNDCLYRQMKRFRRVVVNDFDEFIRPQKHRTLPELITHLENSTNRSTNYVIRNAYFFLDDIHSNNNNNKNKNNKNNNNNISSHLTILRYRRRAPVSPKWHRVKPIITTDSCTHLFSHQCLGLTRNFSRLAQTESVDPALAVNQHYRRCPLDPVECAAATRLAQTDDSMLEAKEYVTQRMRERVRTIMNITLQK